MSKHSDAVAGLEQKVYFVGLTQGHATATTGKCFGKKKPLWLKLEEQSKSWLDDLFLERNLTIGGCKSIFPTVHFVLFDLSVSRELLREQLVSTSCIIG